MRILVIDDEEGLRRSIVAYLEDLEYVSLQAANGYEGLQIMRQNLPHLDAVLLDLNMPVLDGYGFLKEATAEAPDLPIVVLSGAGLIDEALRAVRLGAWDYLTKPLDNLQLDHTLTKVLEKARLIHTNKEYQENLEILVHKRTTELENTRRQIMHRLSRAAEYKDNETGHHVTRVGEIAAVLAKALGFNGQACSDLRDCAPLHDIGKIGIPDAILLKPGKLDPDEWKIMKKHCIYGCEILSPIAASPQSQHTCLMWDTPAENDDDNELLDLARTLALLHHERWDGTGYPLGLRGEQIPLEARIVAIVDTYDALASERPYKQPLPEEECLAIIQANSGTHFDPAVVEAFFKNIETICAIRLQWRD